MQKNPQTTSQLHSSHMRKEVVLKIQQVRLQQYVNCGLPVVQSGFRKGIRTRVQIDIICWIIEKAKAFQKKKKKTSTYALLTTPNPSTVWITMNRGKFFKKWENQSTCPVS